MPLDLEKEFSTWVRFKNKRYFQDYQRIQRLMLDEDAFLTRLEVLEQAVQAAYSDPERLLARAERSQNAEKGVMALVLREKELAHGFKASVREVPTLTGIIPGPVFLDLVSRGHPMKDVGVSRDHGEYTHRVQWYVIAVDHEQEAYHHTPLELYQYIYAFGPPVDPGPLKGSMWDCLFDRPGYDPPPPDDIDDYLANRETRYHSHFSCPENLNRFLLDEATGRARFPFLWKCMSARDQKRGRQIDEGGSYQGFIGRYVDKLADSDRHEARPDAQANIWWKR
ncbi:hypothetical protein LZ198_13835 [Myxococcus sp. K15C18031901]|uniref:LirA/MavJ family T4SS effector n=1 Tax=Myxococcus dinghuensis TaxID=2906761 RepID=UPI0020A7BB8A|nr:LirA/MavJ family T4SS effector [Myxococcus dinghuensis]MCP3099951.1 hypothetical protein [Myxococcus dinghuensis]